jgi:hypothetical protein
MSEELVEELMRQHVQYRNGRGDSNCATVYSDAANEITRLRAELETRNGEAFAYCFTDVNGKPAQFCDSPEHASEGDLRVITSLYRHAAPVVPEGYALVPSEFTDAMHDAIEATLDSRGFRIGASDIGKEDWKAVYKAMLSAAKEQG